MAQKRPTIQRVPSWKGNRGSIFYGDSSLPAPLLDECFEVFTKYSIKTKTPLDKDENNINCTSVKTESAKNIIQKKDLISAFNDLGIISSDIEVKRILTTAENPDAIKLDEFCRMVRSIRDTFIHTTHSEKSIREENILDAWCHLGGQKNKTGKIDANKMKILLSTLGLQFDVKQQLKELDIDQNGAVDFSEFQQLFKEI